MWEKDTLNVPLTLNTGPALRQTDRRVSVGDRGEVVEASGCTVSILCCAEIDLTFKLPTVSKLSSMKHNFVLPEPKTCFGRTAGRLSRHKITGQWTTRRRDRQERETTQEGEENHFLHEDLLDWAVRASMGWVQTPKPISERAAREKRYKVSGFRPSTAQEPAGLKLTCNCRVRQKGGTQLTTKTGTQVLKCSPRRSICCIILLFFVVLLQETDKLESSLFHGQIVLFTTDAVVQKSCTKGHKQCYYSKSFSSAGESTELLQ